MQFLSEPSGGSDVAGVLTSAVREDDEWVLNGSKIWTTGAWVADWGLCLARTNWDVPKHRGLTVFILPIRQPGVDISRIEMLNGNMEFCQEFLTDVRVPDTDRIGEVDGGWTVGTRWLFHERMLHNSPLVTVPPQTSDSGGGGAGLFDIASAVGRVEDPAGTRAHRRGPHARARQPGAQSPRRPESPSGRAVRSVGRARQALRRRLPRPGGNASASRSPAPSAVPGPMTTVRPPKRGSAS